MLFLIDGRMDGPFAAAAGPLSTCLLLFISGIILIQCGNKKKAPKKKAEPKPGKNKGDAKKDGKKNKKEVAKKEPKKGGKPTPAKPNPPTGPNPIEDEPRKEGVGAGVNYQTLGNLDRDIFVKEGTPQQTPEDEGPSFAPPSPSPGFSSPSPAPMQNPPSMQAPPRSLNDGPGAGSQQEAAPLEGIGQGQDYQTWNNLDQNVFVGPGGGAPSSAPTPAAPSPAAASEAAESHANEAAPLEGIGQGQDYQTWNNLDKDVFVK